MTAYSGTCSGQRTEQSDSLSQIPFAATAMAVDLDDHELGAVAFKADTANIPSCLSYGVCICLRATSSWLWQFAMSTEKSAIFTRRKINAGAWTSWVQL